MCVFIVDCPQCLFSRNKYSIWPSSNGECVEDSDDYNPRYILLVVPLCNYKAAVLFGVGLGRN